MDKFAIIELKRRNLSNREVEKLTGINRKTVARYWNEYNRRLSELNGASDISDIRRLQEEIVLERKYDTSSRHPKKYTDEVDMLLSRILSGEDEKLSLLGTDKQKLTYEQIHRMIVDAGFDIGLTTISKHIRLKRESKKEAYIKQQYDYGDRLEYDFGDVKLEINGRLETYHMAVFAAPASKFIWAYLYTNMRKEVFMDSHVRFFDMLGGIHKEIVYDNMRNVVSRFVGRNEKELNPDLLRMSMYYGFSINVTNCFSGNEKGYVESSVKKLQRQIFALRYKFSSIDEAEAYLNEKLEELNKNSLIEAEKEHLTKSRPKLELGEMITARVDKYSFVRVDNNYYSVPEHLVGHKVNVKIYLREIFVYSDSRLVANHKKIDGYQQAQVDIYHYLETLEKKPGALKNSKALKSKAELKTIYDKYFTGRTKEFIDILRSNSEKNYSDIVSILIKKAEHPRSQTEESAVRYDRVAAKAKDQIALLTEMFAKEETEYVN